MYQIPIFPAQLQFWMFCYQSNCFRRRIKCSVLHLCLGVHNRFLCITYRRCMTASATPYAKDFWSPILGYRDRCFCDCFSPYDDISDGMFHDPHSYERFSRVYPNNSYHRISKNYLVRRKMVSRERRTRPLALPRRPKAWAVSLPPICEFQLADNS